MKLPQYVHTKKCSLFEEYYAFRAINVLLYKCVYVRNIMFLRKFSQGVVTRINMKNKKKKKKKKN